jgi:anti-sigma factor ChrR (cupin superfamily)
MVRCEPGARFPVHTHAGPEFLFILEGELVQSGRRLGPGWAAVGAAGSVDADVRSDAGCLFILVDRAADSDKGPRPTAAGERPA